MTILPGQREEILRYLYRFTNFLQERRKEIGDLPPVENLSDKALLAFWLTASSPPSLYNLLCEAFGLPDRVEEVT